MGGFDTVTEGCKLTFKLDSNFANAASSEVVTLVAWFTADGTWGLGAAAGRAVVEGGVEVGIGDSDFPSKCGCAYCWKCTGLLRRQLIP
jgi:hypothetical protein